MKWMYDDGGRKEAGYKGIAGDCVTRAIAISTGINYQQIYNDLSNGMLSNKMTTERQKRNGNHKTARKGITVTRKWFKDYMKRLGFQWIPCMGIGTGCRVHLANGELPNGKLIVSLSRHYTSVIDGVIHDTYDPQRATIIFENGVQRIAHRCVYGYWKLQ